jgi:hypothetical protein
MLIVSQLKFDWISLLGVLLFYTGVFLMPVALLTCLLFSIAGLRRNFLYAVPVILNVIGIIIIVGFLMYASQPRYGGYGP